MTPLSFGPQLSSQDSLNAMVSGSNPPAIDSSTLALLQQWNPGLFGPQQDFSNLNPYSPAPNPLTTQDALSRIGLNDMLAYGTHASNQSIDPNYKSIVQDLRSAGLSDQQIVQAAATGATSDTGRNTFDWGSNYNRILQNALQQNPSLAGKVQPLGADQLQASQQWSDALGQQLSQSGGGFDPGLGLLAAGAVGLGGLGAGLIGSGAGAGGAAGAGAGGAEAAALTGSGSGALAGGAALPGGMSLGTGLGAAGTAAGGGMATDVVPSFDQIVANAAGAPMISPGDYTSAAGMTTGNAELDALLAGGGSFGSSFLNGVGNIGSGLTNLFSPGGAGSNILSGIGNIASGGASLLPGILALNYARNTGGIDTSGLSGILGQLGGNQDAIVKAATDPLQRNIAGGYGDLLQSQSARGIRGSSFGDTDISNYIANTGAALSGAGANALQGSLSLQGNLASQIAQLQNQSQLQKNQLYGTAFDALGRALNPQGYAGSFNLGGTGTGGGSTASSISGVGQLMSGLGTLGSGLYSGLTSLFG